MSWRARPLVAVTLVAVASTAGILSGCSLSNSSTARSTPTPASDQPYPTPTAPTPTEPTGTPTPTATATRTATPTPTPSPTPTPKPQNPGAEAEVLYGYLDSIARTGDGYTVSYRPATRCLTTKAPACRPKPHDVFADGSWLTKAAKTATHSPLSSKATGSVTVKGKTVEFSLDALTPLPAPGGLVVDLRSAPVAVKMSRAGATVTKVAQLS